MQAEQRWKLATCSRGMFKLAVLLQARVARLRRHAAARLAQALHSRIPPAKESVRASETLRRLSHMFKLNAKPCFLCQKKSCELFTVFPTCA